MSNRGTKSHVRSALLATAVAIGTMGYAHAADMPVKAVPAVPFFFVNDTSVSFTWFPKATDPGVSGGSNTVPGGIGGAGNTFGRYQGAIDHFDVWQYGTNLIHAEFNQYGDQDPSLGIPGAQGSREFFGVARSTLGFNELSHSKAFSNFLVKDVSLEVGGNAGVQDDYLDEHTTVGVFGLQFALNLPGVVDLAVMARKEYTRNAFDACGAPGFGDAQGPAAGLGGGTCAGTGLGPFSGDREFEWTWTVESFVSEPLTFLPSSLPLTFTNLASVVGPKGTGISTANLLASCTLVSPADGGLTAKDCIANAETKTEVFEEAKLVLDSGKVFWGKPGIWDTYVGWRYWYNKFGVDHTAPLFAGGIKADGVTPYGAPGTAIESTFLMGSTYHFK
jgi:hypothetical protein